MKEPVSVKNPMIVTSPYGDRIIEGRAQFHRGVDLRNFRPAYLRRGRFGIDSVWILEDG